MNEFFNIAGSLLEIIDSLGFILPQVGVGGGMEVKESVDIVPLVKFALIFMASIAALFGIGLAFAAQKFSVKEDPRVEEIKDVLAHAHCGACGYPGCAQYAEAVVKDPDLSPALCTPGGAKTTEAVARITGKAAEVTEPIFSRIMCQGDVNLSVKRFKYEGIIDCRASVLAGGGDKACIYGCLGYGTCVRSMPYTWARTSCPWWMSPSAPAAASASRPAPRRS
jgi:Na+-translocating ferredoxin:NAD+ oxidoreductase RNF subunit RnfB